MSSELYWDNLGVDYPEKKKEAVVRSAYEIRNFLYWAKTRLAHRVYSFSFKIQEIWLTPSNDEDLVLLQNSKQFYLDQQFRQQLDNRSIIDREKFTIKLRSVPKEPHLFVHSDSLVRKVPLRIYRVVLRELEPKGVSEDDEDFALDLLFEQSNSVYDKGSIGHNGGIRIIERHRNNRSIVLGRLPQGSEITVNFNTTALLREYKAIDSLVLRPKKHNLPLLNLLQKTYFADWEDVETDPNLKFNILKDGRDGTEQQKDFVRKALATPDLAILEGPPGSGKTTTILELILQLIPKRKRVLLVASTHVAVDNVIEKLMEPAGDGQNLLEKYGVVPLRVGYLDDISEKVSQYHIDNFVKTELDRLLKFLGSKSTRTEAQEVLYEALSHKDRGKEIIENIALESANLVCGTTIGVLQSRAIKESKESKPAFDYLILDEASKTTFQEFLVPALNAERWILSGDPKQLAPYVDQDPISENVSNLRTLEGEAGREDKQLCLNIFSSIDKRARDTFGKLIVYPDESDLPRRYEAQSKAVEKILIENKRKTEVPIYLATGIPRNVREKLNLLGSNLVLLPESRLKVMQEFLPPSISNMRTVELSDTFNRRRNAYKKYLERKSISSREGNNSWKDEVAWRIARLYELKGMKNRQEELLVDLQLLVPHFEAENRVVKKSDNDVDRSRTAAPRDEHLLKEIRKIEKIALPSVLELLRLGFGEKETLDEEDRIPLYNGLPDEVLKQRLTLLENQHRMHPQISAFPRDKIYSSKALRDSSDMLQNRVWKCDQYVNRVVWINTKPSNTDIPPRGSRSNYNMAEIRVIANHIKRFMSWSRSYPSTEPGSDGFWSVAVLSFYKGQENRISEAMRNLFQTKGYRYFESPSNKVRVEVCTVDRFQGHEADLVFVSFVNSRGKIGFLDNRNRLNVALTRAKYQLVLVGERRTFSGKNSTELLTDLEHSTPDGPIEF